MERYQSQESAKISRRSNKNQELYQNIGTNTKYTNFTDVTNANVFDIDTAQSSPGRRGRIAVHRAGG